VRGLCSTPLPGCVCVVLTGLTARNERRDDAESELSRVEEYILNAIISIMNENVYLFGLIKGTKLA
jgi:hypothetical protein